MTDIQPIEIDGKHYIDGVVDGQELQRRGPFQNAEAAEATAAQLASFCRGLLRGPVHVGAAPTAAKQTGSATGTPESCHGRS